MSGVVLYAPTAIMANSGLGTTGFHTMVAKSIIIAIAFFYAYGALVHVMNMLSLNGFDWTMAPFKWQALDVIYLILDLAVVLGLFLVFRLGVLAFFTAAISQILLYTVFRPWVLDVPEAFRRTPEEVSYLNGLVAFHIVTMALMLLALWLRSRAT